MSRLNIRIDDELKDEANELFSDKRKGKIYNSLEEMMQDINED